MAGIVFFRTEELQVLKKFYQNRIEADLWRDQGKCLIFDKNGFKFGFCKTDQAPETCGVITFLFDSKEEVENAHGKLEDIAVSEPVSRKPDFDIYQFYGKDPEGRTLEFQCFLDREEG